MVGAETEKADKVQQRDEGGMTSHPAVYIKHTNKFQPEHSQETIAITQCQRPSSNRSLMNSAKLPTYRTRKMKTRPKPFLAYLSPAAPQAHNQPTLKADDPDVHPSDA